MQPNDLNRSYSTVNRGESVLSTNAVLKNTYLLLGMTLMFSGVTAYFSTVSGAGYINPILFLIGAYGLMFLTQALRNSVWGIASVFAFTGFMGYTLGPLLNMVLQLNNGADIIMTSLGGTGLIFFALSGYVLTTRKDFSFMSGFLVVGTLVLFISCLFGIFVHAPAFHLAISAGIMLLSSGMILWQTSAIIHGGERNYIMATVALYVQIYNLFVSLLQLLSAFSNNRD